MTSPAEQDLIRNLFKAADMIKATADSLDSALNCLAVAESGGGAPEPEPVEERNPYDNTHPSGLYALGYSWDSQEGGWGMVAYWDSVEKTWLGGDFMDLPIYGCKGPYQDLEQARDAAKGYEW
jgi:hypothetical protein